LTGLEHRQSPFVELIGGRQEEMSDGYVRLSLMLEERHMNPNGVMHGGVITTLMDEAAGGVIASVRGIEAMEAAPHATVDMNVSFLSGARPGDELVVEGRALRVGRSAAFAQVEARRRGGPGRAPVRADDIVATGRFTFVITRRPT
jgi:uncharacterized protein (TIGR00369 family)